MLQGRDCDQVAFVISAPEEFHWLAPLCIYMAFEFVSSLKADEEDPLDWTVSSFVPHLCGGLWNSSLLVNKRVFL